MDEDFSDQTRGARPFWVPSIADALMELGTCTEHGQNAELCVTDQGLDIQACCDAWRDRGREVTGWPFRRYD